MKIEVTQRSETIFGRRSQPNGTWQNEGNRRNVRKCDSKKRGYNGACLLQRYATESELRCRNNCWIECIADKAMKRNFMRERSEQKANTTSIIKLKNRKKRKWNDLYAASDTNFFLFVFKIKWNFVFTWVVAARCVFVSVCVGAHHRHWRQHKITRSETKFLQCDNNSLFLLASVDLEKTLLCRQKSKAQPIVRFTYSAQSAETYIFRLPGRIRSDL